MRFLKWCLIILVLAGLTGASAYGWWRFVLSQPIALKSPTVFEVTRGEGARQVLSSLEQQDIISAVWPYKVLGLLEPDRLRRLRAGEFEVTPDMTAYQLLDRLSSNEVVTYRLTIPEGWTFHQMRQLINGADKLDHSTRTLDDNALMAELGHEGMNPEGRFFPSTYRFHKGTSDLHLYRQAFARMSDVVDKAWAERDKDLPLTSPYEALILASLIEKETGAPEERREIAGVFVRRLEKGMRLQTDPTVIYGLGKSYNGDITRADLKGITAYNTYVIDGLPPTPIALPGKAAIDAAVHPLPGSSLYFVAKGGGRHQFSDTLAEHNRAVRRYQLGQGQ
ncbi:endolytic transglycosylase MltG [Larsenimonas rhizosphaerae]|uniref:Endolytic murein transglycosylase n=1 Tax=Larsenimonas rhizosphaerae TaxID=2944682 RepID=A0AA41ZKX1_9GAMM|nr:endolytic transglycosylase MltG [Larsenimonas rhizosphaerae]MCM2130958.1 endolytic transglycosylase MltG [Larsenimonas rhizosphaerae]MCX2523663.1 endolytic transglycosylase MltG [Larsenimonas rhizosphaerae]